MGTTIDVKSEIPLEDWVEQQTFESTKDITIPEKMSDRVIGQDKAVEVMKKAAFQKRHVMLIGEPGTGKSMLANSMIEHLPKEDLQDVISYHNPEDVNEPRIRTFPAGKGKAVVYEQKMHAATVKNQKSSAYIYACIAILVIGLVASFMFNNFYIVFISLFGIMI
ncbi:MAG: ATP-binding protein, partial [Candidatus Methanoplasma sp.]|nr:ATP-binding protein [Candidatus Methanoplasma sp.]